MGLDKSSMRKYSNKDNWKALPCLRTAYSYPPCNEKCLNHENLENDMPPFHLRRFCSSQIWFPAGRNSSRRLHRFLGRELTHETKPVWTRLLRGSWMRFVLTACCSSSSNTHRHAGDANVCQPSGVRKSQKPHLAAGRCL